MRFRKRRWTAAVVATAAMSLITPAALPAHAEDAPAPKAQGAAPVRSDGTEPSAVPAGERRKVLGAASDRAWTTSGDAAGFHVLVADAASGYSWKTAASLSEPGPDTDAWIGNACLTGSGRYVVAVYAPRTFTNKPALMARGAFAAVVDLDTGKVRKLPVQASLAYFSPGCGAGDAAVLSQFTDESMGENATRLITVDAAKGTAGRPREVDGQITSAIPYGDGVTVAAQGTRLVRIGQDGSRTTVARTRGVPFELTRDAAGGVTYLEKTRAQDGSAAARGEVAHVTAAAVRSPRATTKARVLASGRLDGMDLAGTASGEVFVTGSARTAGGGLPAHLHNPGKLDKDARMTSRGHAAVTSRWKSGEGSPALASQAVTERTVATGIHVLGTGRDVQLHSVPGRSPVDAGRLGEGSLPVRPSAPAGTAAAGRSAATGSRTAAASGPNDPVDDPRTCSVPRNDTSAQAFQPTPRQVEWAVDQAVIDGLDKWITRSGDWKGMEMALYSPQELFPIRPLLGDPDGVVNRDADWHIPAQILLGITAQESNMWQASRYAVPGVTANPLIGNFYGIQYAADGDQGDAWAINWDKADCGYGITQITDGMRLPGKGQPTLSYNQQMAAALDYTANIAAGADKLAEKWNQTRSAGLIVNDGKPKYIENWYFALWAYNAGFYERSDAPDNKGKWGVGWTNNPANPLWKANRTPFLENSDGKDDYSHAAHPQDWPYQEKVMGWAARPISALFAPDDMQPGYRAAWWSTNQDRTQMKAPEGLFCDVTNECDPGLIGPDDKNEPGLGACNRDDMYCWWNQPVTFKNCDTGHCGNAVHRFNNTDYPEQADATTSYPPRCSAGLPSGTLIVDDVPNNTTTAGVRCGTAHSDGTFAFTYKSVGGAYPGKIDTHQIGAGYGNHFWFSHTRKSGDESGRLEMSGLWTLGQQLNGWTRILVHLPDHGAHTQQAKYEIDLGGKSFTRTRYISQKRKANEWVSLGVYNVSGTPRVRLGTTTKDGDGSEDVAWDAVAFQKLPAKPKHMVAVLGDSYTSGEGAGDYLRETDSGVETKAWNACRRSKNSWSRKTTLPGTSAPLGELADSNSATVDFQNVSCSGAHSWVGQVLPGDPLGNDGKIHWDWDGSFREIAQMDSGILSDDTTLVALTIGGNDADFPTVIQDCATIGCAAESDLRVKVDDAVGSVSTVLEQVAARAKNAKIVLLGYPRLFNQTLLCSSGVGTRGVEVLNNVGQYMIDEQQKAVAALKQRGISVSFESPDGDFEGKRACDSTEGINKIVKAPTGNGGDFKCTVGGTWCISRESYHPNKLGTSAYSSAFLRAVNGL
ncbi:SGNH/GDSL hydrolase family protein [Streptomyces sp. NBC_00178]|uniref:SGNH/GDSL hydrolase family protein n=1 Tax=Streptomyces sp. NBC_00178 TaxID=2975672 RepID=UPI002E2D3216|nr:SGNH/GDSL hydrolase family protein [Streptomyces sp. NBC_00178]